MTRTARHLSVGALLAFSLGCAKLGIFEDVGSDPHPPRMTLREVWKLTPTADPLVFLRTLCVDAAGDTGQCVFTRTDLLQISFDWSDLGADLELIRLRDLNSSFSGGIVPAAPVDPVTGAVGTAPKYFPGTQGQNYRNLEGFEFVSALEGDHRFEVWAQDSHLSRSDKSTFTIHVAPYPK